MLPGEEHSKQYQSEGRRRGVPAKSCHCEALRSCRGGDGLRRGGTGDETKEHTHTHTHILHRLISVLSSPGHRYRPQSRDLHSGLQAAGQQSGL